LKIANIHYQQMEKADRDYTHAKRAEDEYRKMITTYPDSKLVPEAKQRLLEVEEVLAEREFRIGHFYYLRESYPASIARLQSRVNQYPLYSKADEALYLLGQDYEGQIARVRSAPTCDAHGLPRGCAVEAGKARYIAELTKEASEEYDKILTRYPMMDRADDARKRLVDLHQPVPRPTKGAVAQNKAEIASRTDSSTIQKMLGLVKKGPDMSHAAHTGDPSLNDNEPVAATSVVRKETFAAAGISEKDAGNKTVGVEVVNDKPAANDAPPAAEQIGGGSAFGSPAAAANAPDPNELKPNAPADPNELKPTDNGIDPSLPPPSQVNELAAQGQSSSSDPSASKYSDPTPASDTDLSSSKHKKHGLKKIVPF
jgi:outer membrane protein assembly factor BamD